MQMLANQKSWTIILCTVVVLQADLGERTLAHSQTTTTTTTTQHRAAAGDASGLPPEDASQARKFEKRHAESYETFDNSFASAAASRRAGQQQQQQQQQNEVLFSNQTGAVISCPVALDLARGIARASQSGDQSAPAPDPQQQQRQIQRLLNDDIQIKWERSSTGDEIEPIVYGDLASMDPLQTEPNQSTTRPIRHVRPSDGALIFEPFRAADFRADVHLASYRCVARSLSRPASLVGGDVRVRGLVLQPPLGPVQVEVLDELAIEGNSAQFKCQISASASDYLQVLDWLEYPGEQVLSYHSTLTAYTSQQQQQQHKIRRQIQTSNSSASLLAGGAPHRYFVAPRSGELHIVNVDSSLDYKAFKCRTRNKLTGEIVSSVDKAKLMVTDTRVPLPPRLTGSSQTSLIGGGPGGGRNQSPQPVGSVFQEGEQAMLACNIQAYPRPTFAWFKRSSQDDTGAGGLEQLTAGNQINSSDKYFQIANLLVINKLTRNDSAVYVCLARNPMGEERLDLELLVRGPLRASLRASANVLELGKSLALECLVSGHPIHQVIFKHNQNIIKSISGSADSSRHSLGAARSSNYFVVDEQLQLNQTNSELQKQLPVASDDELNQSKRLSHVIVIVLEPQHAGAYQCFARNQFESVQSSAYIRVLDDPPKFRDTFKAGQVFEPREDISLLCSARANPLPEITWSIDGQPIPESTRIRFGDFVTKDNLVISYVNISHTQVLDSGLYKCSADNGLASISHEAQISVAGQIQVKPMSNVTVVASTTFKQRCLVAGHPVGDIQWLHNGRRLPANHRQRVHENGTLEVEHMEKAQMDEGEYTCVATSGAETATGSLFVQIKVRPSIEPFTVSRQLREGQRASIMCTISSGDLPIHISWFRNEQPLFEASSGSTGSDQNKTTFDESIRVSRVSDYSSTLLFESVQAQHSANYTCLATNDAGQVSHQAFMLVQVAPKWNIEPVDTNIVRGSATSIDCMASGFPPPRIIWTKAASPPVDQTQSNSLKLQHPNSWRSIVSSPHLQVHENGSLNILDARDSDFGLYMCQASNGVGPGLSKVIRVLVNVAAQFNSRHSVQYVTRGEQTNLKCQAKGDWPLTIHWFKNKNRLEPVNVQDSTSSSSSSSSALNQANLPGEPNQMRSSSQAAVLLVPNNAGLTALSSATLSQVQSYKVRGSVLEQLNNLILQFGSSSSSSKQTSPGVYMQKYTLSTAELALSPPSSAQKATDQLQQQAAPISIQVNSVLSISQADRQDTGTFKCFAANHFGLDERTIQLIVQEPPDRVDEISVLEVNSRSISLGWLAPFDGNSVITNYQVQYKAAQVAPQSASSQSEMLNNLNWFNYTLTSAAVAAQSNLTSTQVAAPSGAQRALVKITINSLRPVTRYWFRVGAENKLGLSQMSSIVESLTMEEAPGAAPGKIKAIAQSSSSILVSWERLNDKEIFGSVHGYYVAYKPSGDHQKDTQTPVTNIYKTIQHDDKLTKFDALLTGLKKSTKYVISLQAFNARGTGPSSEPLLVQTLEMDSPRQVKMFVKQTSNSSIQLEWRPMSQAALAVLQANKVDSPPLAPSKTPLALPYVAVDSGAAEDSLQRQVDADVVDYYSLYQAEINDKPRWHEIRLPGNTFTHTVDNLRCGTRYQFYMMGVNKIGVGDQSDILDTKTAGGRPLAPDRQSTLDVINTTCFIIRLDQWRDNGCPMREYSVRFRPESSREWTKLADLNVDAGSDSDQSSTRSSIRAKRDIVDDGFSFDDDDDSLMDYYSSGIDPNYRPSDIIESKLNSSESRLFSLLKDSMVPTFNPAPNNQDWYIEPISNQEPVKYQNLIAPKSSSLRVERNRQQMPPELSKVGLCNLLDDTYYIIQVTAINSVGSSEAELKILTSPEGIEMDADGRRQVIGLLGVDRTAQSAMIRDRLNTFLTFNHWPILVPMMLTLTLVAIIIISVILLRRASASGSSTSTATTTTSSRCREFLDDKSTTTTTTGGHCIRGMIVGGGGSGSPGAMTDVTGGANTEIGADSNAAMYNYPLNDDYSTKNDMLMYRQCGSTSNGPVYGIMPLPASDTTNRSSSSPTTTAATSGSNGMSVNTNQHFTTLPHRSHIPGNLHYGTVAANHSDHLRGRSVFLCAPKEAGEVFHKDAAILYGAPQSALYDPQSSVQLRQFAYQTEQAVKSADQTGAYGTLDANKNTFCSRPMDQTAESFGDPTGATETKIDNCFLNIVDEVARATDSLSKMKTCEMIQCNQSECRQHQCQVTNGNEGATGTNYASVLLSNSNQRATSKQNEAIFDPTYATIRCSFPQAFKPYLTLQQQHFQTKGQQFTCEGSSGDNQSQMIDSDRLAALNLLSSAGAPTDEHLRFLPQPQSSTSHQSK